MTHRLLPALTLLLPFAAHAQSAYPYANAAGTGQAGPGDLLTLAQRKAADQAKQDYLGYSDVRTYGAICNGSASNAAADTAGIKAALAARAAAGGGDVHLPYGALICQVDATIVVPQAVHLVGEGAESSHLYAAVANMAPMVQLAGNGSSISHMDLDPNAAGVPTSGSAISFAAGVSNAEATDLNISAPCDGIDLNGNTVRVQRVYINLTHGKGCVGLRVGNLTTGGTTVNPVVDNVTVSADTTNPPDAGMVVHDAGGLLLHHSSVSGTGTLIKPGSGQVVQWTTGDDTYLGDLTTSGVPAFKIDTGATNATVEGTTCNGCWASSASAAAGVQVTNTGGGTVTGTHFNLLRAYGNGAAAILLQGGTDFTLDASTVCGTATGYPDISVALNVSSIALRNNVLGGRCDSFATTPSNSIALGGNNADMVITGNDLHGTTTPVSGTPVGDSVVNGNTIIDTQAPTLATAPTVALTNSYSAYQLTGTTSIAAMTGAWNRRRVRLFPAAAVSFATGGNICAAYSARAGVPVDAEYVGACWLLK